MTRARIDMLKIDKFHVLLVCEIIIVYILAQILFMPMVSIPTESMAPTIEKESILFAIRAPLAGEYNRRDIIIFPAPDTPNVKYAKRIIGLPGETVEIINGVTYINGFELDEPYVLNASGSFGPYKVPEGHYFCMGDNRDDSFDSRYWDNTYVDADTIEGKAICVWWHKIPCYKRI